MKDLLIKLTIIAIIAAVLCAGFMYLDYSIAGAQYEYPLTCKTLPNGDEFCCWVCPTPIPTQGPTATPRPYPAPEYDYYDPYPAPVTMPFSFPTWFQVILDSIAAWL